MMKKLYFTLAMSIALPFAASAQVFIQNTMFPFNKFVYNPAAAGASGVTNITGMFRSQWLGVDGAPTLFTLGADAPVAKLRGAVGGYLINDKLGPLATTGVNVSYAFRFRLGDDEDKDPTLAIGAQGGFLQKRLNGEFRFAPSQGVNDPIIPGGNYAASTGVPSLGAGIYLSGPKDNYYAGISVQDLLQPSLNSLLLTGAGTNVKVPRSIYAMGGYTFTFTDRISLQPNVGFRTDGRVSQLDINAMLNVKPMVFGLAHRWKDSFSAIAGFNLYDRFFLAYSYDYTISGMNAARDIHSHEIVLSYKFPQVTKLGNKIKNIFEN